jgi:RNA polymerase sigma-70 factor (ECF subfamily)
VREARGAAGFDLNRQDGSPVAAGRETYSTHAPAHGGGALPPQGADFDYESALARCALGDRMALHEIYRRDARWLMSVAQRIVRRRELADEVLHDAFLQIWQKADQFKPQLGSGRGWIFTVVRHRALNLARGAGREVPGGDALDDGALVPDPIDSVDSVSRPVDPDALHGCLQRLDEIKRDCVLLAYVDGYTHRQIAQRLAAPLGSVKAWIRRGLVMLRTCLT